jgi:hypothetical protein
MDRMNQVTLKADGVMQAGQSPVLNQPLLCLGYKLALAPDFTLRSYFRLLETYAVFAQLGDLLQQLLGKYARCPQNGCLWPAYEHLEFAKVVEMIGFPGEPKLEIYNIFHGVKGDHSEEIRELPLEALLDMPVLLGQLKHIVFGDHVDTFRFETVYTLFEFIDSIAWELSFHGAPPECQIRS